MGRSAAAHLGEAVAKDGEFLAGCATAGKMLTHPARLIHRRNPSREINPLRDGVVFHSSIRASVHLSGLSGYIQKGSRLFPIDIGWTEFFLHPSGINPSTPIVVL